MTTTEKKKALYKEKPKALRTAVYRDMGSKDYEATLKDGTIIKFHVPIKEQGDDKDSFGKEMDAQLLIRWML